MANMAWNYGDLYQGVYNSAEVTRLQGMLVSLGYQIAVDGDFGPDTDAAVREFQTTMNLRATGTVDNLTAQAIEAAVDQGLYPGRAVSAPPVSASAPTRPATSKMSPLVIGGAIAVGLLLFMGGSRRGR